MGKRETGKRRRREKEKMRKRREEKMGKREDEKTGRGEDKKMGKRELKGAQRQAMACLKKREEGDPSGRLPEKRGEWFDGLTGI